MKSPKLLSFCQDINAHIVTALEMFCKREENQRLELGEKWVLDNDGKTIIYLIQIVDDHVMYFNNDQWKAVDLLCLDTLLLLLKAAEKVAGWAYTEPLKIGEHTIYN